MAIGDSGVGKSSLILKFTDNLFDENMGNTIGIDFKMKDMVIKNKRVKLQIWDTVGQERYRSIITKYYRGADVILLVFDITSRPSFVNCGSWLSECMNHVAKESVFALIGNKLDLQVSRNVPYEEAEAWAKEKKILYFETSCKTDKVDDPFLVLTEKILAQKYHI
uniref:Uncharacterized protein n=1 Tax=Arcella intermedia TaxID=1963864 RepID=A0A6B2LLW8_9EUKA